MIIVQILFFVLILLIVPFVIGQLLTDETGNYLGSYLTGFVMMLAVFQVLDLLVFWFGLPLHVLSAAVLVVLGGGCVWSVKHCRGQMGRQLRMRLKTGKFSWILLAAVCLIVLQTVILAAMTHIDQDDAFYVGTAVTSVHTDSIFQYDCYTGLPYTEPPSRYILSPLPIFTAFLSQISGMHAAMVAHIVFPLFFIPLSYFVYWLVGKKLFDGKVRAASVFLLIIALFQMFSFTSVYTSGTFLLVRIWQGKAILANILLPAILYMGLTAWREQVNRKYWLALLCLLTASCMVSSMGIMLAAIMTGVIGIICAVKRKSLSLLRNFALCCIPNVLLSAVYILIR